MLAWAARPAYCLTLEISSYYWAANLSSTQLYSELICNIKLHNTLTEATLWSFLQAVDQVSAMHAYSRRRLFSLRCCLQEDGDGEGWYEIPRGCKKGRWSVRASKEGTGLIDKRSKDWAPFSLPFAFLLSLFLFQLPFLLLFPDREQG